jgi:uncharacterized protein YciI
MAVFAVTTAQGDNWDPTQGIRHQPGFSEHARFFDDLVARGIVILGGPITSVHDEEVALLAVEAADERELREIFIQDPWATSKVLRIKEVRPWALWLDSRRNPTSRGRR